jgi:hypothetical protein
MYASSTIRLPRKRILLSEMRSATQLASKSVSGRLRQPNRTPVSTLPMGFRGFGTCSLIGTPTGFPSSPFHRSPRRIKMDESGLIFVYLGKLEGETYIKSILSHILGKVLHSTFEATHHVTRTRDPEISETFRENNAQSFTHCFSGFPAGGTVYSLPLGYSFAL